LIKLVDSLIIAKDASIVQQQVAFPFPEAAEAVLPQQLLREVDAKALQS